jgi:hypothetical protein
MASLQVADYISAHKRVLPQMANLIPGVFAAMRHNFCVVVAMPIVVIRWDAATKDGDYYTSSQDDSFIGRPPV